MSFNHETINILIKVLTTSLVTSNSYSTCTVSYTVLPRKFSFFNLGFLGSVKPNYEWFPLSICYGCGMSTGNAYLSGHIVPSPLLMLQLLMRITTGFHGVFVTGVTYQQGTLPCTLPDTLIRRLPFWGLAYALIVDTNFPELAVSFLDLLPWKPSVISRFCYGSSTTLL